MYNEQLRIGFIFIIFFASLANFCYASKNVTATARIVGGVATSISRVPYLVNLRINGVFQCGGTLISRRYVVTAAHCVRNVRRSSITIVGGTSLLSRRGIRRGVSRVMVPKKFRISTMDRDIAVLKLQSPIRGRNIRPIGLCNSRWRPGRKVRVSGWGLLSESATTVPNRVRTVQVPIISKRKCRRRYRGWARLTNSMFCASVPGRKDSCSGDSGGPLVYRGRLCGVVSFGVGCARRRFPGVYTSIRRMRSFIRSAMRK